MPVEVHSFLLEKGALSDFEVADFPEKEGQPFLF